jgi:hypothetical protein
VVDVYMAFDKKAFTAFIIEFLSATVNNVGEIETCWRQMQTFIGSMEEVVNAFVLPRQHPVDDDMKERLNRP